MSVASIQPMCLVAAADGHAAAGGLAPAVGDCKAGAAMSRSGKRYAVRLARDAADVALAQELRARCFRTGGARDVDVFDDRCTHFLVFDERMGKLVGGFRILPLTGGQIRESYSAQYYDLEPLTAFEGQMVEMGRFCIAPDVRDPDVLRAAWAAMTAYVDGHDVRMLFGCSSFPGTRAEAYLDAFAVLRARHLAPKQWLPRVKAPDVFRFAARLRRKPDTAAAMARMPPLLRTYLTMGGWVSDHAVVDRHLDTIHVFTGVEIAAIPPARQRLLRGLSGA